MARPMLVLPEPARVIGPAHSDWPASLDRLPDPPSQLRVAGRLPALAGAVAVVGTRYADDDALDFARELGRALAAAGRAVISGGALGIDGAAHQGALEAGGCTVAVLANGFDPPYPRGHVRLFERIAGTGALLSEQPDGTPPVRWSFLARNRLIAALAEAVVVVQAPVRSGALSTAAFAVRLEKQVFTVPYAPWQVRGQGCLGLLRRGARICTSARDVLSVRPHGSGGGFAQAPNGAEDRHDFNELDDVAQTVLRALGGRPRHPDELASALGMRIMTIQQALLQLLLQGLASEQGPGAYVKRTRDSTR